MTNEIRTRRLIVTLPGTAAEEVDELASVFENVANHRVLGSDPERNATVVSALDDAPLELTLVEQYAGLDMVNLQVWRSLFTPDEARKLAALLLRTADEIEEA